MLIIQVNCIICLKLYPEKGQTVLLSSGGITVFMLGFFFLLEVLYCAKMPPMSDLTGPILKPA